MLYIAAVIITGKLSFCILFVLLFHLPTADPLNTENSTCTSLWRCPETTPISKTAFPSFSLAVDGALMNPMTTSVIIPYHSMILIKEDA